MKEQAETVGGICTELGGSGYEWTAFEEQRNEMGAARHTAAYAAMAARPGARAYATDVCVPISRLADCILETRADVHATTKMSTFLLGHVGDGNFHVVLFCDRCDPDEVSRVKAFYEAMILNAIAMGGTCTGEHGVGMGKMRFLEAEHGPGLEVMRQIKRALDPLNPILKRIRWPVWPAAI